MPSYFLPELASPEFCWFCFIKLLGISLHLQQHLNTYCGEGGEGELRKLPDLGLNPFALPLLELCGYDQGTNLSVLCVFCKRGMTGVMPARRMRQGTQIASYCCYSIHHYDHYYDLHEQPWNRWYSRDGL